MQIMYQRLSVLIYKGYTMGQDTLNIEYLVISDRLVNMSLPNPVPEINRIWYQVITLQTMLIALR